MHSKTRRRKNIYVDSLYIGVRSVASFFRVDDHYFFILQGVSEHHLGIKEICMKSMNWVHKAFHKGVFFAMNTPQADPSMGGAISEWQH